MGSFRPCFLAIFSMTVATFSHPGTTGGLPKAQSAARWKALIFYKSLVASRNSKYLDVAGSW